MTSTRGHNVQRLAISDTRKKPFENDAYTEKNGKKSSNSFTFKIHHKDLPVPISRTRLTKSDTKRS